MNHRFQFVATTAFSIFAIAACGKNSATDNAASDGALSVSPDDVIVARVSCPDGFANATVCCTGGDPSTGQGPACESWPNSPFHPCPENWTSYPNATSCCSLHDPSSCVAVPRPAVADAGSGLTSPASCSNRCAPGFVGGSASECCEFLSDGGGGCYAFARPESGGACSFTCPAGWLVPDDPSAIDDARCCNASDSSSATECFAAVL